MSLGGRMDRWLDRVPGYSGYRDKERRRDSDRAIREQLALDYGQLAERLGRIATTLAEQRQLMAIGAVDKPHKRLVSFLDRLRTASYGYAPLFSETEVDADALDQIAAFDRALADQQEQLAQQIAALGSADPGSDEFKQRASELVTTVEGLHDRLDHRGEVIVSGKASKQPDVLALLETARTTSPAVAYRLHEGEALSYDGHNYSVIGRVAVETPQGSWRSFQLRGGSGDAWLQASADPDAPLYWLRRIEPVTGAGGATVTTQGQTYNLAVSAHGAGDVVGPQGTAQNQPVRFMQYTAPAGDAVLLIYDWGAGSLAFAGTPVHPAALQLFSRER